ncbi:MAG: ATP-binding protein [Deltaproteobacteria bacterium]|nr:ATP-binding protein [Deltaproteobacteria bacterium]
MKNPDSQTPPSLEGFLKRLEGLMEKGERLLARLDPPASPPDELFARHIAFRWEREGRGGVFRIVRHPDLVDHKELFGIDNALEILNRNTLQFVRGLPANNVLLWGERGNGKSSAIRGLLRLFAADGLRLVEVSKEELWQLHAITALLRERPYRFILFCDDLSFDESEISYRELKAILDGGLEVRPENVLIYATSNRRHLLPEHFAENLSGTEIHPEEAVSEKISLSERFGLRLGFYPMSREVYLEIVRQGAARRGLRIDGEELMAEAERWGLRQGGRSGRAARQFIDDLSGRLALEGRAPALTLSGGNDTKSALTNYQRGK